MGRQMGENGRSMASRIMDEAIELAIEEKSPYPERSAFIDADAPGAAKEIWRAAGEGYAVVLVASDGSTKVLQPADKGR
jgi:anti-sigma factor RsiW